jgi:hypothetical protein
VRADVLVERGGKLHHDHAVRAAGRCRHLECSVDELVADPVALRHSKEIVRRIECGRAHVWPSTTLSLL